MKSTRKIVGITAFTFLVIAPASHAQIRYVTYQALKLPLPPQALFQFTPGAVATSALPARAPASGAGA